MNKLQMKYNLLHIFFWITYCSIYGYIAIFLQYRGLSNTEIGIVAGGGAVVSIFMSPFISGLIAKIPGLTLKKLMLVLYSIMFIAFLGLTLLTLPTIFIMVLYICLIFIIVSNVPLLSTICMDYLKSGQYINFGLSRGLGSISYAISAVVISRLIDMLDPRVIALVFIVFSILLMFVLFSLPQAKVGSSKEKDKIDVFSFVKKYKVFFLILCGFGCSYAAATSLSTYLINLVSHLGGSTSLYGVAIFAMAASEMPVMAVTHSLLKRFKSEHLLIASIGFYIVRNFTICLAPHLAILIIGMLFQSVSYGLFTAVITYYVNDYIERNDQMIGQTMIAIMTTGVGSTIGNVLGGVLQDAFGLSSMLIFVCLMTLLGAIIVFATIGPFHQHKVVHRHLGNN